MIGPGYTAAVLTYVGIYALLGALLGALVGFAMARMALPRQHLMPSLSALLVAAFVGNAWLWGYGPGTSLFLIALPAFAVWLACGPLFAAEDAARTFVGSAWPAAVVTLIPVSVSLGYYEPGPDVRVRYAISLGVILMVAVLSWLARRRPAVTALASGRAQAMLTLAVLAVSGTALLMRPTPAVDATQPAPALGRPSIVLITLDTTRADHLSLYGYTRRTSPQLKAFASGATLYRHAYATGDMTLATHASMFTGLYPAQHGAHYRSDLPATPIASAVPTFPELLRKQGYRTMASVANTVLLDPVWGFARGFDRYVMPNPHPVVSFATPYFLRTGLYKLTLPWLWTEAMRRFLRGDQIATQGENLLAQTQQGPFFLFLNFMESHRPWISSGEFRTRYPGYDQSFDELSIRSFQDSVLNGTRTVSTDESAKMQAAYDGSIAYLDDVVGGLLRRMKTQPWYTNSLIIVTADHGELFGERNLLTHGNSIAGGVTSIPMIVKFPGQSAAREVASPVSQIDVFATIAAAAGITPAAQFGLDLAAGDPDSERILVMESYPLSGLPAGDPRKGRMERALVKGRWKVIQARSGQRELYDLWSDPRELTNLFTRQSDVALDLDGRLREWVTSVKAPSGPATSSSEQDEAIRRLKTLGYIQ